MPFCANCGAQLAVGGAACPECGHPRGVAATAELPRRTENLAITSLVLGIAGFFVCPLVLHILAIVFGNQARTKIRNDPSLEGESMARAGVILGWIGVGLTAAAIVIGILVVAVSTTQR